MICAPKVVPFRYIRWDIELRRKYNIYIFQRLAMVCTQKIKEERIMGKYFHGIFLTTVHLFMRSREQLDSLYEILKKRGIEIVESMSSMDSFAGLTYLSVLRDGVRLYKIIPLDEALTNVAPALLNVMLNNWHKIKELILLSSELFEKVLDLFHMISANEIEDREFEYGLLMVYDSLLDNIHTDFYTSLLASSVASILIPIKNNEEIKNKVAVIKKALSKILDLLEEIHSICMTSEIHKVLSRFSVEDYLRYCSTNEERKLIEALLKNGTIGPRKIYSFIKERIRCLTFYQNTIFIFILNAITNTLSLDVSVSVDQEFVKDIKGFLLKCCKEINKLDLLMPKAHVLDRRGEIIPKGKCNEVLPQGEYMFELTKEGAKILRAGWNNLGTVIKIMIDNSRKLKNKYEKSNTLYDIFSDLIDDSLNTEHSTKIHKYCMELYIKKTPVTTIYLDEFEITVKCHSHCLYIKGRRSNYKFSLFLETDSRWRYPEFQPVIEKLMYVLYNIL